MYNEEKQAKEDKKHKKAVGNVGDVEERGDLEELLVLLGARPHVLALESVHGWCRALQGREGG